MAWQPRDSTALGLALSLQRLDDKPALAAFLKSNRDLFPALASLAKAEELAARAGSGGGVGPAAIMAAAAKRKDYGGCLALAARLAAAGRLDPAATEQKGWCLLGLNRPQEATFAFASARKQRGDENRLGLRRGPGLAARGPFRARDASRRLRHAVEQASQRSRLPGARRARHDRLRSGRI